MIDPLVQLLTRSVKNFPAIKYVWGAVAIAVAGGIIVKYLGQSKAAIIIWTLAFLATVLITSFAGESSKSTRRGGTPRIIIIYSTIIFFCVFMLLTVSVFMGYGPAKWADFLGLEENKSKSFEVSGGSVNFGCERGATALVEYRAPPGYRILNVNSFPIDSSNAKAQTPYVYHNDGSLAKGKVDYFGKDREFFNCPGGGHGKAQLKCEIIAEDTPNFIIPAIAFSIASIISLLAFAANKPRRVDG